MVKPTTKKVEKPKIVTEKPRDLVIIGKKEVSVYITTAINTLQYCKRCTISSYYQRFADGTHGKVMARVIEFLEQWNIKYTQRSEYKQVIFEKQIPGKKNRTIEHISEVDIVV